MSFTAARSIVSSARLATKAPVVRSALAKPAFYRTPFASRAFTVAPLAARKNEVIKETEVPVSIYSPDGKGVASSPDHFSIPVKAATAPSAAPVEEAENEEVIPLDPKVYKSMSPTMQKMSVMDKVIIVTGYVPHRKFAIFRSHTK